MTIAEKQRQPQHHRLCHQQYRLLCHPIRKDRFLFHPKMSPFYAYLPTLLVLLLLVLVLVLVLLMHPLLLQQFTMMNFIKRLPTLQGTVNEILPCYDPIDYGSSWQVWLPVRTNQTCTVPFKYCTMILVCPCDWRDDLFLSDCQLFCNSFSINARKKLIICGEYTINNNHH